MEATVMDVCIFLMGSVQFALLPDNQYAQLLPYSNHAEIGFTLHCSGLSVIVPSYQEVDCVLVAAGPANSPSLLEYNLLKPIFTYTTLVGWVSADPEV